MKQNKDESISFFFLFSSGVVGERLDNYLGGNPNPTYGQIYGGTPGVGGYGGGYGYQSGGW